MPPVVRSRSHGRPAPMWSLSERGLYCVRTTMSSMSELTQLLSVKSMIRYLPANGTAGLARTPERMDSRSPSPPARTSARTRFTTRSYTAAPAARHRGMRSGPGARVERRIAAHDLPVEMRTRGVAGLAHVADELPLAHSLAAADHVARQQVRVERVDVAAVGDHHHERR